MRYPESHRRHPFHLFSLLLFAALFFFGGLLLARNKLERQATEFQVRPLLVKPTPSPVNVTHLRLINATTNQPISNQSVAFILSTACLVGPCPSSSPTLHLTNSEGKVSVDSALLRGQPKLYSAGYIMDHYFSFLNPDQPDELTLYKTPTGAKATYNITREEVLVALTPVTP